MNFKVYYANQDNYRSFQKENGDRVYDWDFVETLSQAAGFRNVSVFIEDNERRIFIPLLERKVFSLYPVAFSLPFGLYGGFVPGDPLPETVKALAQINKTIAMSFVAQNLYNNEYLKNTGMSTIGRNFTHVIELKNKTYNDIFQQTFTKKLRNQVRKANKSNISVKSSNTPDLMADFYELYYMSNQRWGHKKLKYEKSFFQAFSDKPYVVTKIAYYQDAPIAGIILLKGFDRCQYWFGALDKKFGHLCPNHLLISQAIEGSTEQHLNFFDFGASGGRGQLSDVINFKESFGAKKMPFSIFFHGNPFVGKALSMAMKVY